MIMDTKFKQKIMFSIAAKTLGAVADCALDKTRALMTDAAQRACDKFAQRIEMARAAFESDVEDNGDPYAEAPEGEINPYQYENQK